MTVKLKTPSNGSVSLTPQDTASDVVVTVPSTAGSFVTANSSGNVGIGTSSPGYKLDVNGTIRGRGDFYFGFVSGSQAGVWWSQTGYAVPAFQGLTSAGNVGDIVMQPGGKNLLIGTTSNPDGDRVVVSYVYGVHGGGIDMLADNTNAFTAIHFRNPNGVVGSIFTNGSNTTYNTSSDYRLKENIQPMQNALATVAQLNPVTYTWKTDGSDGQGFIAHELQAVVPDCVTGEKDEVDADGKPVYQGVDTSFLVATLTAAIQEQQAIINSLQDRITALENA